MSASNFSTPARPATSARGTTTKRDSLAAELERDPQSSSAKRQQRSQAFTSTLAHASLERQLVAARTAKMELESKLRERDATIERLEGDRRWLAEREKEEREEKEQEREERDHEKRTVDHELRALRNALTALREEHADLQDAHGSLSRTSTQTITTQKAQLSTAMRQVTLLEDELREVKSVADARSRMVEELQNQLDTASTMQVNFGRQNLDDDSWAVLRQELQRQADYMRKLEGANARMSVELTGLRERHASLEVLREEKRDLERKLEGGNKLREEVLRLEAEVQAARQEREEWAKKAARLDSPSETPITVTQNLSSLRLTHASLLEEYGASVALLRRREAELADTQVRATELGNIVEQLQQSARSAQDKIAKLEHAGSLADREIGFLQALNASYASEAATHGSSDLEDAKERHIRDLEVLLDEYKTQTRVLEGEVEDLEKQLIVSQDASGDLHEEKVAIAETKSAHAECDAAVEQHLERIETLEQTLFELRGEIGAGRHLPPGVRVLSLRDNPAQQWEDLSKAAMDRLKVENDALLKRLQALEADGARTAQKDEPSEDLVPRNLWEIVVEQKKELEDMVKQKEKRLLRLQQVFTAKSAEFREAIAAIMGVKLAFYPNGQVRVTSQYDLNASFVFQPTSKAEGARMQLIAQGEGGPQDLPQLMRNWIEEEQCVPCFLASITLECYDKWRRDRELGLDE